MRNIFLLIALVSFVTQADAQFRKRGTTPAQANELNYANPQEYIIGGIDVTGLKVLDKNALVSLTGLKVGDKIGIPGDEISSAIKKLWKHGLVGDVAILIDRIEDDKVFLMIELAERPRLTGFTFEGVKSGKESELREDLNLIRGRIISDAIIRNTELTVKNFYIEKGFLNTDVKIVQLADTVSTDGVKLKIIVNPKSKVKINRIEFVGNDEFGDTKLKKRMKSTHEHVRFSLFKRAAEFIADLSPKKAANFLTKSHPVSGKEFRAYVNDNVKLNFFNSSKFLKSDYEVDKNSVISFYNSKGYRDAEIVSDSIYAFNDNAINIRLKVDEGNKYYFRDIIWKGNYVHSDKTLSKILDIQKGDTYNKELIDQKLSFNPKGADISGLYMDDGYLFFRVTPIEVAVEGDSIDVEMRIYEGEQATIRNVIIAGNDRTRDHVVRRELTTIPGQKFSRSDIIRSQQRLAQLGYFDPEQINPVPLPNPADGTVDIEWNVVERSNDQIELSGGWGGAFGFVGTLGLTLNNFSVRNMLQGKFTPTPVGDGQQLSIRAQANGRQFQSYSFSFTEPWLGGKKPNSFSVSFNYSVQRRDVAEFDDSGQPRTDLSYYDKKYNAKLGVKGITIGLGRRLEWPDNYFTLTNSLSYLVYSLENYNGGLGFSNGNANSIALNATLSRNSVDNPMYPSTGSTISLSATFTPPYSAFRKAGWYELDKNDRERARQTIYSERYKNSRDDEFLSNQYQAELANIENSRRYRLIEYHKWMFDTKYYIPVIGKLVLETKAHFGFIGSYSKDTGIGPFERFYLGGDGLAGQNFLLGTDVIGLRGYENNTITPPDFSAGSTAVTANQLKGGVVYNKFGMELRYPITTGQAATIYGFVFAEGGNNWNNYDKFNPFDMYRSAGVGARIFMPAFGLIGLNWGYGFDTLPGRVEKSGAQFHFTIGQQIR